MSDNPSGPPGPRLEKPSSPLLVHRGSLTGGFTRLASDARGISFTKGGDEIEIKDYSSEDVRYRKHFNPDVQAARLSSLEGLVHRASMEGIIGKKGEPAEETRGDKCIAVVDCFSTGAVVSKIVQSKGYKLVGILSKEMGALLDLIPEGMELKFDATIQHEGDEDSPVALSKTARLLQGLPWKVHAVIPGAETGVELADRLSEFLGLRTNGTEHSEARRNKYKMGETVRASGTRAVQQKLCSKWEEVEAFLKEMNPDPFKVVLKPLDSAGSDDVLLCDNVEEVKKAFGRIVGKVNGLGLLNENVLVQEYLEGLEYVVDTVSLDGEHKITAIWEYDRRPINGMAFVPFGYRLVDATEPRAQELMDYQRKVLDALGIKHGPAHGEVKWFKGAPCLVEVGARCHGGEGAWATVATECIGYTQTELAVDVYTDPENFHKIPDAPRNMKASGQVVWLVSQTEGKLKKYNHLDEIKQLSSFRGTEFFKHPGDQIVKTIDVYTLFGNIRLANPDKDQLAKDYQTIQDFVKSTMLDVEAPAKAEKPKAVAVVDPFSTGACVASYVAKRGYKTICVYSEELKNLDNLANFVPAGLELHFDAVVEHIDKGSDDESLQNTMKTLLDLPFEIVAVIPGAEPGVNLADLLSDNMGLRSNGTSGTEARRNKYLMGEKVRSAGVRAVAQKLAKSWQEAEGFIKDLNPQPFKLIVKPLESAGSDDVCLCESMDDVKSVFERNLGKINKLGYKNDALLVQEFLEGKEYVIDTMSRDGKHKVVAVWEYDRRDYNGSFLVCFGQRLLDKDEERVKELIDYQFQVLDALEISHGPGHAEVKWFKDAPCLVEVGSRCHGGEGVWIPVVEEAIGYSQAELAVDAYIYPEAFEKIPDRPSVRKEGRLAFLCSGREGTLAGINNMDEVRAMPSFIDLELFAKIGDRVEKTINVFTWVGCAKLVHESREQVVKDYDRLHELVNTTLLDLQ